MRFLCWVRAVIFLVATLCSTTASSQPTAAGQPVERGTSAIEGQAAEARTGEPLNAVIVRLFQPESGRTAEQQTGADGRYAFADIADGVYTITATSPTHGRSCYGATDWYRVQCEPVPVVRDQRLTDVSFRMLRSASLSGMVVDHEGRAVADAKVATIFAPLDSNRALTGRDGRFELSNILPGENRLVVDPPAVSGAYPQPAFGFPDGGQFLQFAAGGRQINVVIRLPYVPFGSVTAQISGAGPDGLVAMIASAQPRMSRRLKVKDGVVVASGLREGRYYLYARGTAQAGTVAAFRVVDLVDGSYEVSLPLAPTGSIAGQFEAERGGLPPLEGVRVEAVWTHDGVTIDPVLRDDTETAPDGHFRLDGLFGRRRLHVAGLSPEWTVLAIRHRNRDVTTTGVEVSGGGVDVTVVVGRQ